MMNANDDQNHLLNNLDLLPVSDIDRERRSHNFVQDRTFFWSPFACQPVANGRIFCLDDVEDRYHVHTDSSTVVHQNHIYVHIMTRRECVLCITPPFRSVDLDM